jgi:WD40 repeat protein
LDEDHRSRLAKCFIDPLKAFPRFSIFGQASSVSVRFDEKEALVAFGLYDRDGRKRDESPFRCVVWDVERKEIRAQHDHNYLVRHVTLSPDGQKAASVDARGQIDIWEASTGDLLTRIGEYTKGVMSVDFAEAKKITFGRNNYREGAGWRFNSYAPLSESLDFTTGRSGDGGDPSRRRPTEGVGWNAHQQVDSDSFGDRGLAVQGFPDRHGRLSAQWGNVPAADRVVGHWRCG